MSTRIVITGGAGFLGSLLARRILAEPVALGGSEPAPVGELLLLDLAEPHPDLAADPRVRPVVGPLEEALGGLGDVDAIFHLAGVVSGAAEADFDLGMRTNLDGTRALLQYARGLRTPPVLVFSSSLAVFGNDPALPPLGVVDDNTLPRPQSSYGIQKFIGEQLVADYTRKGFVRGRSVRLMTVSVRPGKPNAAASSFLSGIIREPLSGQRAVCPVAPETPIALSSPRCTVDGLLRAAAVGDAEWGSTTAMNLPALTTNPREMAEALDRVTGSTTSSLIDWTGDPGITAIVGSWPAEFDTPRARRLGLEAEKTFDDIIRAYLTDNPGEQ
ncbi:NAD-dependent epimerase/dehydratase family protein [Amycolatopsis acidicola]|uniref:NAD-dependent epimerase/dehydratase family protein n=1 Tax=Amycolatopsis acidicola TaxID=2596893 RepID=A0A5N0VBS3_9PSEU|nr:D-erythronate dehydrogenase [Amycolatopsis acidicola]KAA9162570.1 NAD-dependent epimerase/dehydratase family protein [Amycolatopsis acidicola]